MSVSCVLGSESLTIDENIENGIPTGEWVIRFATKVVIPIGKDKIEGILVINADKQALLKHLENFSYQAQSLIIFNSRGTPIFDLNRNKKNLIKDFVKYRNESLSFNSIKRLQNELTSSLIVSTRQVHFSTAKKSSVFIFLATPKSSVLWGMRNQFLMLFLFFITIISLTHFVSGLISARISRPLSKLGEFVDRVGEGKHLKKPDTSEKTPSDIAGLIEKTHSMSEKIKNQTQKAIQNNAELVQAMQTKSDFLAIISHEIRTPMNGILGVVELLKDRVIKDEKSNEYFSLLDKSSKSLQRTVNDFLDCSKLEAGQLEIQPMPYKLEDIFNNSVNLFKAKAEEKGISLSLQFNEHPGNKDHYLIDGQRVGQIIDNLISNAIKFTDIGEVVVKAGITSDTQSPLNLTFEVTDTGIGIHHKKLPLLFEKFKQIDSRANRKYQGTGLGLTIVDSLLKLMNGRIVVETSPNRGTTFRVILPLLRAKMIEKDKQFDDSVRSFKTMRVLIVDDNNVNLIVLKGLLKKMGIDAKTATNGQESIDMATTSDFDLILMDCNMPIVDGYQATRAIRSSSAFSSSAPIYAVTASAGEDNEKKCLEAGMNGLIAKPILKNELYQLLKKVEDSDIDSESVAAA